MPLIKHGCVVAHDTWQTLDDAEPLPDSGAVIVPLARLNAEAEALAARGHPLGVRLKSSDRAQAIAAWLPRLALVALEFPSFRDGRAYSIARRLREQMGFSGEIRAVGNVRRDQLLFMQRCGFDAFEIDRDDALVQWQRAIGEFSVFYQGAADGRATAPRLRQMQRAAE